MKLSLKSIKKVELERPWHCICIHPLLRQTLDKRQWRCGKKAHFGKICSQTLVSKKGYLLWWETYKKSLIFFKFLHSGSEANLSELVSGSVTVRDGASITSSSFVDNTIISSQPPSLSLSQRGGICHECWDQYS